MQVPFFIFLISINFIFFYELFENSIKLSKSPASIVKDSKQRGTCLYQGQLFFMSNREVHCEYPPD